MSSAARDVFRPHALDGALLWFHPRSGMHVRWDGPETRRLVRRAPRVVLFGITNRCNLTCSFCSRDRDAASEWTVESAFEVLAGLARRGTLEVAFGGGEPFAFRGMDELVARLGAETPLAVHLTTNGTLLTPERLRRIAPHVGEIRLSVYEDNAWESRLELLASEGVTFGINVLATPARVAALPGLLARAAELGCRDVAVLRYVGLDPGEHLRAADEHALVEAVANSPVRVRLSVCFGDRLDPVPRLFDGTDGDCGAGLDFVTITSDRTLKACSFHSRGVPVRTADDVIDAWSRQRESLLAPSRLPGCARPAARRSAVSDGVRVWRGFSGNNSGDCVLVGRFEEVDDARRYIEDLLPGWGSAIPFPTEWESLLEREGIRLEKRQHTPESMARIGRTVMLHTDMTLEDDFPSLRALLWRRGGKAVYSGVHEHGSVELVAGIRFADAASLEAADTTMAVEEIAVFERRGLDLYGSVPLSGAPVLPSRGPLHDRIGQLESVAQRHGGVLAAELAPMKDDVHWPKTLAARPPKGEVERLWAAFRDAATAASVAASLDRDVATADRWLVVESKRLPSRIGFHLQRSGGTVEWMGSGPVQLAATFWRPPPDAIDLEPAEAASLLRAYLGPGDELSADREWRNPRVTIVTQEPGRVLKSLVACAKGRGVDVWIHASAHDRMVAVTERIRADLEDARKVARKK